MIPPTRKATLAGRKERREHQSATEIPSTPHAILVLRRFGLMGCGMINVWSPGSPEIGRTND